MADLRAPATPESELQEIRQKVKANRKKIKRIEERNADLKEDAERWKAEDRRVEALLDRNVKRPWLVIAEAERAEAAVGGLSTDFVIVCLAVLWKETGIPQRNVFGCDHGPQGGRVPYCGDEVTRERGLAFVRALHAAPYEVMNGVSWTQTTWFEKVFRVEDLSPDLTDVHAHLRVCLGDLALLIKSRGLGEGIKGYNGSGPAADAYRDDVLNVKMPIVRGWLPG